MNAPVEPINLTFDIGHDSYGRMVRLCRRRSYLGKHIWSIHIAPASQRDEGGDIDGLSIENLQGISSVIASGVK